MNQATPRACSRSSSAVAAPRWNARRGSARTWISLALLLLCGGAALFVWLNRMRPDTTPEATAFVERLIAEGQAGGPLAAADGSPDAMARKQLGLLAGRAGSSIDVLVAAVSDGGATHRATVSNDVGDRLVVRLVEAGRGSFRVLSIEGALAAPKEVDARPENAGPRIAPPRAPGGP